MSCVGFYASPVDLSGKLVFEQIRSQLRSTVQTCHISSCGPDASKIVGNIYDTSFKIKYSHIFLSTTISIYPELYYLVFQKV
jgi:hypothetical protein